MNRLILALARTRGWTAILLAAYFIPMVLYHRTVSRFSLKIERSVSYPVYNRAWGIGSAVLGAAVLIVFAVRLARGRDRAFRTAFLLATFVFIGASHVLYLAVNLEYIHILQFSLVVFPLFALTGRFADTVFWTGLLGAVDELYQYYYAWWPHQSAYDFNDIALDAVGGLFMAVLLFLWLKPETVREAARFRRHGWKRSPVLATSAAVIVFVLAANAAGILDFYPPQSADGKVLKSDAPILLSKVPAEKTFWTQFERKKKTYHLASALEWALLMAGLTAFSSLLDRRSRPRPAPAGPGPVAREGQP